MIRDRTRHVLLVRVGAHLCALPLASVVETMRPLPVRPLAGVPESVAGASIVRGEPTPVVLLSRLLGDESGGAPARFVRVRCGDRHAAIAVDAVAGIAEQPAASEVPLLSRASQGAVASLGELDRELLAVLDAARLVPDEVWRALQSEEDLA